MVDAMVDAMVNTILVFDYIMVDRCKIYLSTFFCEGCLP